ncbi:MAG TPA: sugar phosphate isomerase/epimerase, partial [Chloroflexi bacterium]|nr:sugar phosphate isomerase/epimerase [Chloroflexota bacterium]
MKLSTVLSIQPTQFEAVALKGDLTRSVAKIAALGYDGVELAVRDPKLLDADEVRALVQRHGLAVPAIGTG